MIGKIIALSLGTAFFVLLHYYSKLDLMPSLMSGVFIGVCVGFADPKWYYFHVPAHHIAVVQAAKGPVRAIEGGLAGTYLRQTGYEAVFYVVPNADVLRHELRCVTFDGQSVTVRTKTHYAVTADDVLTDHNDRANGQLTIVARLACAMQCEVTKNIALQEPYALLPSCQERFRGELERAAVEAAHPVQVTKVEFVYKYDA